MSVLEQIEELEAQKQALIKQAKGEALDAAKKAVVELNSLGFNYQLVESDSSTGTRRTGIRKDVQAAIANSDGMSRADIDASVGADGKSSKQSVSNALSALKKSGAIRSNAEGLYTSV